MDCSCVQSQRHKVPNGVPRVHPAFGLQVLKARYHFQGSQESPFKVPRPPSRRRIHGAHLPSTVNVRLDLVCLWREKSRQPSTEQRHEFVLAAEGQHGSGQMDAKQRQPCQRDEREQHHAPHCAHNRKPVQNPCGRYPDAESRNRQERKQQRLPGMQRRQTMPAQKQSGKGADPRQEISQDAADARRAESVAGRIAEAKTGPALSRVA